MSEPTEPVDGPSSAALRAEVAALRRQVHDLKAWVSTSTRAAAGPGAGPALASDDDLADALVRLAHGLQNWVLTHYRRAVFRGCDDGDDTSSAFSQLVPVDLAGLAPPARLPLLQAAAARVLVDDVFAAVFVGLPPADADLLARAEARLRTYAPLAVRQWRAQTLALVAVDAAQQLPPETARVADAVVARITRALDAVTRPSSAPETSTASAARDHGLRQLVASAVALARALAVQRAEYELFLPAVLPHQQLLLDPATMESVGTEDDDDDDEDDDDDDDHDALPRRRHEVVCAVFPGLIKHGDDTGRHGHQYTNVLCKARVLCTWAD